eukprot:CAMPEP_0204909930 /NCGR_PEP_ID=MMETSP1397-20131031/8544_1 /ASSEMBLY_ACC=CAM_ASM_000891 /TAXON_ID=49980 /ORGANISM="Climacostomum Climacostomum virens, Strain Stock W-24" /LENGTH=143 /DNA_ID=CAMNT_0052079897 /DNA_START=50 /DNA_END=478 /DNA_ORIENTATION=-
MLWLLILGVAAEQIKFLREYSLDPGHLVRLELPKLKETADYEIRVSYLGTAGADVQLRWNCPKAIYDEKLYVRTENSKVFGPSCDTRTVEVLAVRNSKGASEELDKAPIKFFVTVEEKWWGIPESVLASVSMLSFLLGLSLCW